MLSYKLDPDVMTPQQLSDLTKQLCRLATDVSYNQATATLSIEGYGNGKEAIDNLVWPYLAVNDAPIDWSKLASLSAKRKLQIAR